MADVYRSHVRGLIGQIVTADGHLMFSNLDAAATQGVEAEFEGKWGSGFAGRISYSNQHATDLVTDKPMVNSAGQLATANVTVPLMRRRLFAAMDLHYVGRVETLDGSFTHGFIVPNLTLTTQDVRSGLSLSASVYNLFNRRYGYPGGDEHRQNIIYQDGRTLRVGLTYSWRR
jgi:iron complex outermembrane receptor protein